MKVTASKRAIRLFLVRISNDDNTWESDKWLAKQTLEQINNSMQLTKDQVKFLKDMLYENVVHSAVKQPEARRGFAIRILNALGDNYNEYVDHSSSEKIINAKLKSGEIKAPRIS
jgi:hypothetical protein